MNEQQYQELVRLLKEINDRLKSVEDKIDRNYHPYFPYRPPRDDKGFPPNPFMPTIICGEEE